MLQVCLGFLTYFVHETGSSVLILAPSLARLQK